MAALISGIKCHVYQNIKLSSTFTKSNLNHACNIILNQLLQNKFLPSQVHSLCTLTSTFPNSNTQLKYVRNYSSVPEPKPSPDLPKRSLPQLMEFPEIVWPSIFKSVRNWILSTLIIAPYFDREFSLYEFVVGSKRAVEVVSHKLSAGNYKELDGLVANDAIETLHKSLTECTMTQRQQIAINSNDIYFSFPYQVGIMFNDETPNVPQKRFVEITMVYHVLQGLEQMRDRGEEPPLNVGMLPEFRDKIHVLNYRFIREFTKGVEDGWTINVINHFKPNDFV